MNIEAFLLCDAATEQGGKLNLLGAFDSINTVQMPCTHPACAIVVRMRFERIEEGEHKFRINVIDEDGKSVVPRLDGVLTVPFRETGDSAVANSIVNILGLNLVKYGKYRIDLAVDGQVRTSLPLIVGPMPSNGQT